MSTCSITSFLDTDLYKITMQAAIHHNFSKSEVEYKFNNRSFNDKKFSLEAVNGWKTN